MTSIPDAAELYTTWAAHIERTRGLVRPTPAGAFSWRGLELPYLDHPYNDTILNERCVEVPIAMEWWWSNCTPEDRGLEVGNVLQHYLGGDAVHPLYSLTPERGIVDLYEEAPGVNNVDVLSITGEYDWIVSVSTLEHVYQDFGMPTPDGPLLAMDHLWGLLRPGGEMLVTIPFGQQPFLDAAILGGGTFTVSAEPDEESTMVRADDGTWQEKPGAYWLPGREKGWARAVWVATWRKPA